MGRVWLRIRFDQLRVLLGGCKVRVKVVMALGQDGVMVNA